MNLLTFSRERLLAEMDKVGGKPALVVRLRERYRHLTADQARKQVERALKEPVGLEIAKNILSVLELDRSRYAEVVPGWSADEDKAVEIAGLKSELSRSFKLHAEVEPLQGKAVVHIDKHGEVLIGGALLTLSFANAGERPLTVVGLRLSSTSEPVDMMWFRSERFESSSVGTGAGARVDQTTIILGTNGYKGRWILQSDPIDAVGRSIATDAGDLFRLEDGGRISFKVAPRELEQVDMRFLPERGRLHTFELTAMAVDAEMERVTKRTAPIKLVDGRSVDG